MSVDSSESMAEQDASGPGSMEEVFDDSLEERQLLIIGKTGNGKSSVGNILLRRCHFKVGFSMASTTVKASTGAASFKGWKIKILDTPDITNIGLGNEDEAQREVCSWKALTSPECHAILLAVRCDVRYTREEFDIYLQIKKLWGGMPLCRRLIVVFTFGDRQDRDIRVELKDVCPELKSVLKDASKRYIVFNDKDSDEGKAEQARRLMQMVDEVDALEVKNEERRLLTGLQVCPQGPLTGCTAGNRPPSRQSSTGDNTNEDIVKLVLVGKTGNGKSATGNTIIGRCRFPVHPENENMFHPPDVNDVQIDGKRLQVVDTPGFEFSTWGKSNQQEWKRTLELILPGPHALLFVVRHNAVTLDDLNCFRYFKKILGSGLSEYTVIVLVGISPALQEATCRHPDEGPAFDVLLEEAGGKLWAVRNNYGEPQTRETQMASLMMIIQEILKKSRGKYFPWDRMVNEMKRTRSTEKNQKNYCWFL